MLLLWLLCCTFILVLGMISGALTWAFQNKNSSVGMCCQGFYASNVIGANMTCPKPFPNMTSAYIRCDTLCCASTCAGSSDVMRSGAFSKCTLSMATWTDVITQLNDRLRPINASCQFTCGQFHM